MAYDTPKKHKAITEAPSKKAEGAYFMFPANKEHPEAVTVFACTQAEAEVEYRKIISSAKI